MDGTPKQVVECFYRGLADGAMDFDLLSKKIEWITPASLPWTLDESVTEMGIARYKGFEEFGLYLQSMVASVEGMRAVAREVVEVDDGRVLALGEETGRSTVTGKQFSAPFAHLLTVAEGKITRLRGYVDTAVMRQACQSMQI